MMMCFHGFNGSYCVRMLWKIARRMQAKLLSLTELSELLNCGVERRRKKVEQEEGWFCCRDD